MICYRDMTFCSDGPSCGSRDICPRHFTDENHKDATRWLGDECYPVAFSSFAKNCEKYYEDANHHNTTA